MNEVARRSPVQTDAIEFSSLDPKQVAAIREATNLAQDLIISGKAGEILSLLTDSIQPHGQLRTYLDIAGIVIPNDVVTRPQVAKQAVYQVILAKVPEEERLAITKRRRQLFALKSQEKQGDEKVRQSLAVGRDKKAERIRSGDLIVDTTALVEGRGKTRWSADEETLLALLTNSSDFRHVEAHAIRNGTPDWKKIADFINRVVHGGENIRTVEAVSKRFKTRLRLKQ